MQNIPVLFVSERSLALAYEKALTTLHEKGIRLRTEYDKAGDPPSIDATMDITILDPASDPMIHRAFPGGIEDLREYVMEVQGAKDHWVKNMNDPSDTRWEYTYHGRLAAYGSWRELQGAKSVDAGPFKIDQVETVIRKLAESPFSRRAQMITWMPNLDRVCYDPPCLQSLWYRILEDDDGVWWLNCNVRFRSNDAWGASFMNMFGFIQFNRDVIAAEVSRRSGRRIELGRLNWHADSYHIYGKDIAVARQRLFDRLSSTPFEERVYNFADPDIRAIYDEAGPQIREKIKTYDASQKLRS